MPVSFLIKLKAKTSNFIKKETLAQVFSCEICEIFKNTFLTEHLWLTASGFNNLFFLESCLNNEVNILTAVSIPVLFANCFSHDHV